MSEVETGTIETRIPGRLDRLPWSRWHWLVVIGLGTVWILDGLGTCPPSPRLKTRTAASSERETVAARVSGPLGGCSSHAAVHRAASSGLYRPSTGEELIPARVRAGSTDHQRSFWLGTMFGAALSLVLLDKDLFAPNIGWRIAFGLGAVLGLGILLVRRNVPESPAGCSSTAATSRPRSWSTRSSGRSRRRPGSRWRRSPTRSRSASARASASG